MYYVIWIIVLIFCCILNLVSIVNSDYPLLPSIALIICVIAIILNIIALSNGNITSSIVNI